MDRSQRTTLTTVLTASLIAGLAACSGGGSAAPTATTVTSGGATAPGGGSASPAPGGSGAVETQSPASSGARTTAGGPAPVQVRTLNIIISARKVKPAPDRIKLAKGELLRLNITSDRDDSLHIHGFEIERELFAGRPALIELRGGPPGLYEVETHNPPLRLLQLEVR
jgi:hypothetical protein